MNPLELEVQNLTKAYDSCTDLGGDNHKNKRQGQVTGMSITPIDHSSFLWSIDNAPAIRRQKILGL